MRNVVVKAAAWLLKDERARSSGITECMVFCLLCLICYYSERYYAFHDIDIVIFRGQKLDESITCATWKSETAANAGAAAGAVDCSLLACNTTNELSTIVVHAGVLHVDI